MIEHISHYMCTSGKSPDTTGQQRTIEIEFRPVIGCEWHCRNHRSCTDGSRSRNLRLASYVGPFVIQYQQCPHHSWGHISWHCWLYASNQKVPDEDPFGTIKVGHVELSLKESKTPLEKVNISQYMEGSLRIWRAMAIEDKADLGHIFEYVTYLIKFATLARSFQWQSLLKYDLAYRKGESEMMVF